ncbi:g9292 [Coccomyxa elongata]
MVEAGQRPGITTFEATIDAWGLSDATAHQFKTLLTSMGAALDKPPEKYWAAVMEEDLEHAGFQFLDRLQILTELRSLPGGASMAIMADFQAQLRTLAEAQQADRQAREVLQKNFETLERRGSVTNRSKEAEAVLELID